MRVTSRLPKTDKAKHLFLINNRWEPLKEPKNTIIAILLSIPLMALCAFISLGIIKIFKDISLTDYGMNIATGNISIEFEFNLFYILGILLLLIIHEILHLIFIPNFIKSDKTYIGIVPVGGYVYTEEILTKKRYIIITILPFITISIILPTVLGLSGLLNPLIIFLIFLNSMSSGVDILTLILICIQVPSGAKIISNGTNTYWKKL
jgi:hypothetical protein